MSFIELLFALLQFLLVISENYYKFYISLQLDYVHYNLTDIMFSITTTRTGVRGCYREVLSRLILCKAGFLKDFTTIAQGAALDLHQDKK